MYLGKIVKSNSHTDYVCQVYGPGEVEELPSPPEYAFGTFVCVPLDEGHGHLVGLIYDTVLLNPDFGNLGPRLSPAPDLAVFSPDYLAEKVTLAGITAVGTLAPDSTAVHGVPSLAAQIDTLVERMDDDAIRRFHRLSGGNPGVRLGYAPLLLALGSPLARHLLLHVVDRLSALFPDQVAYLSVLRGELAWQAVIGPVGGAS
ncbi:MAG: hypothetical protein HWN51_03105 [Desulfobacterales bacterium]|nr:hypothetical protein [Desulfobacterales bacterium]